MSSVSNVTNALRVGDVVQLNESFGENPLGSIGVVYETYTDEATVASNLVSVILANGHDIGTFTVSEQFESFTLIGYAELTYQYRTPGQLMADYRRGDFNEVFAQALALDKEVAVDIPDQ